MEQHGIEAISTCFIPIATCFIHSVIYVASLYIWKTQHDRNHPSTIRKRFISVFVMFFISPLFLYIALDKNVLKQKSFWAVLGLRTEGLIQAFVMPLFLTMILFLGPLSMQIYNGLLTLYTEPMYWVNNMKDSMWLRSHVVAPLSEEYSFRSCMLPLLLQCFKPIHAIFICPIFFGAAHFHHIIENVRYGMPVKSAILTSCFHFTYTTIFGAYSAFLFYRTGHLASSFIAHAFCNHMGVPALDEVSHFEGKQRLFISVMFVLGIISWSYLLNPLTEPRWYYNLPQLQD